MFGQKTKNKQSAPMISIALPVYRPKNFLPEKILIVPSNPL